MNLTTHRREIAQWIEDETAIHTHPMLPPNLVPPCAILAPGDPYVTSADVYTKALVTYELRLVAPNTQQPETALEALEELVDKCFTHLDEFAELTLGDVTEPYSLVIGNTSFPAMSIQLTTITAR